MFPIVGAQGTTTLRLIFASIIMLLILRPWRVRMTAHTLRNVIIYGMALGGMNFLFYMASRHGTDRHCRGPEFTGPLAVAMLSSRRPIDFLWIALAIVGLLLLLPAGDGGQALTRSVPPMPSAPECAGRCTSCSGNVPGPSMAFRVPRWGLWWLPCLSRPSVSPTLAAHCSHPP